VNESEVFTNALMFATPAEQAAYVDEACRGDLRLRAAVEALLRARASDPDFLEQPAGSLIGTTGAAVADRATATAPLTASEPGAVLAGRYKLLEMIGEGGMGTVWMAQQQEPVRRTVAVKLVKPGMDSTAVVARFEAERQALALMDHPNIAKVFDAGFVGAPASAGASDHRLTPGPQHAGRPYFVMELVKGVPITTYCDEHRLTPRQRLELFVPVCQAVQHAHQKGIIHRDLKPSNVLVALYDDTPVPKVIDFGVAKATGTALTEETLHTSFGSVVGTVEYMSPEQATFNQLDIDTRSDIYSLGVLLYELLTGTTPLDRSRLKDTPLLELMRIVREDDTVRPSNRLSTVRELPVIAAKRGVEPRKLIGLVRGELDWIVMKALEKDRNRRYETANGFAMDVQRHLAVEPVLACPPSAGYRLRKFAQRNKVAVAVTGMVLFFLVLMGSGVGLAARDRAARQSRTGARVDQILAEVEQFETEQKWPEALVAARRAETVLGSGEADAATVQRVTTLLKDLEFVERLEQIRMQRATWLEGMSTYIHEYAKAFRDYGVDIAELPIETSIDGLKTRPALAIAFATALDDWAVVRIRHSPSDVAGWKRCVRVARGIDPDSLRDRLRSTWGLAVAEAQNELRPLRESMNVRAQHPATLVCLAWTLEGTKQSDSALRLLRDAQYVYPGDFWLNLELGFALYRQRDFEGAARFCNAAVSIRPHSAAANTNLGMALRDQNKLPEAIAYFRRAVELDPNNFGLRITLGHALGRHGKLEEAIAVYTEAIRLQPHNAYAYHAFGCFLRDFKRDHVGAIRSMNKAIELDANNFQLHMDLGRTLLQSRKPGEAAAAFREAIRLRPNHAPAHEALGSILRDVQRDYAGAIACFKNACEIAPREARYHTNLGLTLGRDGKLDEAVTAYQEAIRLQPAYGHHAFGCFLHDVHRDYAGAIASFKMAIELDPNDASACENLALLLATCSDTKLRDLSLAVAVAKKAVKLAPRNQDYLASLGLVHYRAGEWRPAIAALEKSLELHQRDNSFDCFILAMAHWQLGEKDKAREFFGRAVESMDKNEPNSARLRPFRAEAGKLLELKEQ
jgi:eukaryotic-like serine/threonine-protein kinase